MIASISVFGFTIGLTFPLLSLMMAKQGVDSTLIGANAAMSALGILASAPLVMGVTRRVGQIRAMITALAITAAIIIALRAWPNIWFWFPLRFLLGASINVLFVLSETWINRIAGNAERGRIVGIYATTLAAGFGLGPLLIPVTGTDGWTPFLLAAALVAAAALPIVRARHLVPTFDSAGREGVFSFFRLAPVLLFSVAVFAMFDGVAFSLLPVYALGYGQSENVAALMVAVLILGNVALQYPIGWFSDKAGRTAALTLCAASAVVGALLLPALIGTPAVWPLLFLWGGLTLGIYTVALTVLGERFSGQRLIAGNAAFSFVWGLGGLAGPALGGAAIDWAGLNGLPAMIALFAAALVASVWFSRHGLTVRETSADSP